MYYDNLLPISKPIYLQIYSGIKKHQNSFMVLCAKPSLVAELFKAVKLDNPDLFYVKEIYIEKNSFHCIVRPNYLLSANITDDILACTMQAINPIILQLRGINNEVQVVKSIHDYLCATVTYSDDQSIEAHSIIGPLLKGKGVCEGIACAFLFLAKQLNIETLLLFGEAKQMTGSNLFSHSWNIVRLSGQFYHIDVTFDLTQLSGKQSKPRYDYFLLSDKQISCDHKYTPTTWAKIPSCPEGYNYYLRCGLFAENLQKLKAIISSAIEKNNEITFQLPIFSGKTDDVPQRIQNVIEKILSARRITAGYELSYNLNQMVFTIKLFR